MILFGKNMAVDQSPSRAGWLLTAALMSLMMLTLIAACGNDQKADTSSLTTAAGGKMKIDETSYDFGSIPVGQKVEHKFKIENVGSDPLEVGDLTVERLEGC